MDRSVLIIVENLPVPFDRRVWMEATTLRKAGYTVSVISPTGKGFEKTYEEIEGIYVYRHPLPPERSSTSGYLREYSAALRWEWRLARSAFEAHRFEVIHACNPPDLIFLVAAWFKLRYGVKFLFDHHDLSPELFESKFNRRGFFHRLTLIAERATFAMADKVISTNDSYRDVAIKRGRKRLNDIHVVRSGPDLEKFQPVPAEIRHKKGRDYLVGYMGVMGEFDGVDHLVRAVEELVVRRKRTDIHFCLVGDGPCFADLQEMARQLGVSDFVDFTGRIPDDEMIERLSSCDICVDCDPLNPLNNKCTMNKILEYMALGRPIVQYDLLEGRRSAAGASLYAEPNDVFDLANKIEELLAQPKLQQRMGEVGRARMIEDLEWRHQAPKLLAAYDAIWEDVEKGR
jgi:glycosyltransferase involved in cell wall biosynthesis